MNTVVLTELLEDLDLLALNEQLRSGAITLDWSGVKNPPIETTGAGIGANCPSYLKRCRRTPSKQK